MCALIFTLNQSFYQVVSNCQLDSPGVCRRYCTNYFVAKFFLSSGLIRITCVIGLPYFRFFHHLISFSLNYLSASAVLIIWSEASAHQLLEYIYIFNAGDDWSGQPWNKLFSSIKCSTRHSEVLLRLYIYIYI